MDIEDIGFSLHVYMESEEEFVKTVEISVRIDHRTESNRFRHVFS